MQVSPLVLIGAGVLVIISLLAIFIMKKASPEGKSELSLEDLEVGLGRRGEDLSTRGVVRRGTDGECGYFGVGGTENQLVALDRKYSKYRLKEKRKVTENSFLFRFELPTPNHRLGLPVGQHIMLR